MANKIRTNKELLAIRREDIKLTQEIAKLDQEILDLVENELDAEKEILQTRRKARAEKKKEVSDRKKSDDAISDEEKGRADASMAAQKAINKLTGSDMSKETQIAYGGIAKSHAEIEFSTAAEAKNFEKSAVSAADVEANTANIGTSEYKRVNLTKRILELRKKESKEGLEPSERLEQSLLKIANDKNYAQEKQHKILMKQRATWESMLGSVSGMLGKIPLIGGILETQVQAGLEKMTAGMKEKFLGKGGTGMGGVMMGVVGIAGLVVGALISIANKAKEAGLGMFQAFSPQLGAALLVNADMVSAMADDFGHINEATAALGANLKFNQTVLGIQTKDAVKILRMQQATSDLSNEELINRQEATATMAKQAGIPVGKLMEDIASSAEYFALNARDGGDNIARAAIEAKKLGLNLSAVESIQESLLNLESSLQAQMEAQVLIGREINLDRARALALSGDQAGLMQEIVKQAGGEAEFAKLNYIARKKLAQAFGLTGVQLAKVVSGGGIGETAPTLHTGGKVTKSGQIGLQQGEVVRTETQQAQMQQQALRGDLKKLLDAITSQTIGAKDNSKKQITATRSQGVSAG